MGILRRLQAASLGPKNSYPVVIGEPLYLYYYPPEFYVAYNGRWMHRLRGSEDAVQRLHEICLDACEQELADTIYW